jgi:hypothetical protein
MAQIMIPLKSDYWTSGVQSGLEIEWEDIVCTGWQQQNGHMVNAVLPTLEIESAIRIDRWMYF